MWIEDEVYAPSERCLLATPIFRGWWVWTSTCFWDYWHNVLKTREKLW